MFLLNNIAMVKLHKKLDKIGMAPKRDIKPNEKTVAFFLAIGYIKHMHMNRAEVADIAGAAKRPAACRDQNKEEIT